MLVNYVHCTKQLFTLFITFNDIDVLKTVALSVFTENKEMGFMMFAEFAPMTIKPYT